MRIIPIAVALVLLCLGLSAQNKKPVLVAGAVEDAERIWARVTRDRQEVAFRRSFVLAKGSRGLQIVVSCDDACTVFLDGEELQAAERWEDLILIRIPAPKAGRHLLAVRGYNRGSCAALAAWVSWKDGRGQPQSLVSDKSWRVAEGAVKGFHKPGFDDRRWQPAREQGRTPFGRTVYNTEPGKFLVASSYAAASEAIRRALMELRQATDQAGALQALDAIEKAVMQARRQIQARRRSR